MEISLGAKKWNVMITNRTHLQQWKKYLSVRQWIKISQLKRVTLHPVSLFYTFTVCCVDSLLLKTFSRPQKMLLQFLKLPVTLLLFQYQKELYRIHHPKTIVLSTMRYFILTTDAPFIYFCYMKKK